jgi:hypothetical protein
MSQAESDSSGNVLPGTVTGEGFAAPDSDDWFLVSHKGILGSA